MKIIYRIRFKLSSYCFLFLRKLYYHMLFGKKFPFSGPFKDSIHSGEQRFRKMDVPVGKKVWDHQYQIGRWNFLSNIAEITRYMTIIGYIVRLKPAAAVLDAGCGEGILFELFCPYGYDRYVGVVDEITSPLHRFTNNSDKFTGAGLSRPQDSH